MRLKIEKVVNKFSKGIYLLTVYEQKILLSKFRAGNCFDNGAFFAFFNFLTAFGPPKGVPHSTKKSDAEIRKNTLLRGVRGETCGKLAKRNSEIPGHLTAVLTI